MKLSLLRELRAILESGWFDDTSYKPTYYKYIGCRSYGQCWVTARALQEVFGWQLVINKKNGNNHYWNIMSDGREVDFTSDQGGGNGYDPILQGNVSKRKVKPIAESNNRRLQKYFERVGNDLLNFRSKHREIL